MGSDSCKCGVFIIAAVTAGGICGNPDIWMGNDADPAAEKSGFAPEATRRTQAREEMASGGLGEEEKEDDKERRAEGEKTAARV